MCRRIPVLRGCLARSSGPSGRVKGTAAGTGGGKRLWSGATGQPAPGQNGVAHEPAGVGGLTGAGLGQGERAAFVERQVAEDLAVGDQARDTALIRRDGVLGRAVAIGPVVPGRQVDPRGLLRTGAVPRDRYAPEAELVDQLAPQRGAVHG